MRQALNKPPQVRLLSSRRSGGGRPAASSSGSRSTNAHREVVTISSDSGGVRSSPHGSRPGAALSPGFPPRQASTRVRSGRRRPRRDPDLGRRDDRGARPSAAAEPRSTRRARPRPVGRCAYRSRWPTASTRSLRSRPVRASCSPVATRCATVAASSPGPRTARGTAELVIRVRGTEGQVVRRRARHRGCSDDRGDAPDRRDDRGCRSSRRSGEPSSVLVRSRRLSQGGRPGRRCRQRGPPGVAPAVPGDLGKHHVDPDDTGSVRLHRRRASRGLPNQISVPVAVQEPK